MIIYEKTYKKQENISNTINKEHFQKNQYYLLIYKTMLGAVKPRLKEKTMLRLLDLIAFYTNKNNKIDLDKYNKDKGLSKNTLNNFRAELSKNGVIKKVTLKLLGKGRFINPLITRQKASQNYELLGYFADKTKEIYGIDIETFL